MIKNKDLRAGDEITIIRSSTETKTVKVINTGDYLVSYEDSLGSIGTFRNSAESTRSGKSMWPEWDIVRVKHQIPGDLPLQAGDVWEDGNGTVWMICKTHYSTDLSAHPVNGELETIYNIAVFKPMAKKILFRLPK